MRFHLSAAPAIASLVFAFTAAASADVIYEDAGPISLSASTVVDSGAGNVDNADLGTDRTLIVTFNVELTNVPANGDGWFAVGFGFDGTPGGGVDPTDVVGHNSDEESDAAGLVRTDDSGDPGTKDHKVWIMGNDTDGDDVGFAEVVGQDVVGAGRITLDLSAAGIAAGESFNLLLEIDEDGDGVYDVSGSSSGTWTDAVNYVWIGSRQDSDHEVTNFKIESIPEPGTLALCALGGMLGLARRRRRS